MKTCPNCAKRIMEHWKVCNDCNSKVGVLMPSEPRRMMYSSGDHHHLLNKYEELLVKNFRLKEMWAETNELVAKVVQENRALKAHNKMLEHVIAQYPHPTATKPVDTIVDMV